MPTAPVAGSVHRSGVPLTRGWLELLPADGTVGRLRSARIEPDGSFRADSVAIGTVGIRVAGADLSPAEFAIFGQIYLIRRAVKAEGTTLMEIDLDLERRKASIGQSG